MNENNMGFNEYLKQAGVYYGPLYSEYKQAIRDGITMTMPDYIEHQYGAKIVTDENKLFCEFQVINQAKFTLLVLRHF